MKKVLLLLANGFECYEASVFIDVIGWNLVDGDHSTELFTCGLTNPVKTTFNQKFIPDYTISEINADDFDALAIPGGFGEYDFYEDAYSEPFLELIKTFHAKGKIIASVCVGSLPIGKSGILCGKRGTTYNMDGGKFQSRLRKFGVIVVSEPVVIEDNIITSWNPSTAIEVALELLEILTSKSNTDYVRKIMGF